MRRVAAAIGWTLALGCQSGGGLRAAQHADSAPANAPVVAAQPGAWFDAHGNLTVVGPGRRLRLVLSAPISACPPAFQAGGDPTEMATSASLPFHVLSEACREKYPTILLAEESATASPHELETSYHEVAHCAATDWGLTEGWMPRVIEASDPCPLALGIGWRLPRTDELQGLTLDDRRAVAGALFDTEGHPAFGGLLLYARTASGGLDLVTLSPNAAEQPPPLAKDKRQRPFFGAALRCVRSVSDSAGGRASLPVLPHAAECLQEQRRAQAPPAVRPGAAASPELQRLKTWLDAALQSPSQLRDEAQLQELSRLLASPSLERIAREARDERALTERYAELAEGLDDPSVSEAERARRQAEFAHLRKRLGGQLVGSAEESSTDGTVLTAALSRLRATLEHAATHTPNSSKRRGADYGPLLKRVEELSTGGSAKP